MSSNKKFKDCFANAHCISSDCSNIEYEMCEDKFGGGIAEDMGIFRIPCSKCDWYKVTGCEHCMFDCSDYCPKFKILRRFFMSSFDFTCTRTLRGDPAFKKHALDQFLFKVECGIPSLCIFTFPEVVGEITSHGFILDRDADNFSFVKSSFLKYIDSFSDDFLKDITIFLYY